MKNLVFLLLLTVSVSLHAAMEIAQWNFVGRGSFKTRGDSLVISGGFAVNKQSQEDTEITFRARAPEDASQVQLWAGFRCKDRDSRYVFALRGGNDNDLYLARYAPDGKMKFLDFVPLDFKPASGIWYELRVLAIGNRFQIYLNDEKLPRINIVDTDAPWTGGRAVLGGGWLPAEFADFRVQLPTAEEKKAFQAVGDLCWTPPAVDKEARRRVERAAYRPVEVTRLGPQRTEISLDGNWLFLPDYELTGAAPVALHYDDNSWHIMSVPNFWTPGLSWLHGETGFPELKGDARTKGVAESLTVQESRRVESYTFDWQKTKSAWYRHYIDLPADLNDRHFELTFDAVAKISEIWVNGVKIGNHTGLFAQQKYDATQALRPGRNVIAVHVISEVPASTSPEQVEGVAVTVEVTGQMLHSLPHGMLQNDVGGIWQPVKLTATAPLRITDCFIQPKLTGADAEIEIENSSQKDSPAELSYAITSANGGVLCAETKVAAVYLKPGQKIRSRFSTPAVHPKLWTPAGPNLYFLELKVQNGKQIIDADKIRFGFRTFGAEGGKFLLNGKPYWLRGGNPFPNTLRPNDSALAHRFMQLARDGNVRMTRSHIVPFTSTWFNAADEIGMGVSFEGAWPWLMLRGEPPDAGLLKVWKEESLSLLREYRNHPSLLLWTVNNEMNFESNDANDPVLLKKKWLILDDMIKAMRKTDPTRPIVADSNYARRKAQKGYKTLVKPLGLDDGDVDDAHCYFGWYNESPFHLFDGEFGKRFSTPGRPLISQEMATGYPNNDDGHPTRFYLFKHHTPEALVGEDAFENADPALFLKRQAFMTKELAEALRRSDRNDAAGILHFSYFTWFLQPWSVTNIEPGPGYFALKTALQPVLVSAELFGRHFYAGDTVPARVCVANDSEDNAALPETRLTWEIKDGDRVLAQGSTSIPSVKYYENHWCAVDFAMPANLAQRIDAQLVLELEANGKALSQNHYDIVVAPHDWAKAGSSNPGTSANVLILGDKSDFAASPENLAKLRNFVAHGGSLLLLHPGSFLPKLFPEFVTGFTAREGEIATMHLPESPVFSGIKPLDLAWFYDGERRVPKACSAVYKIDGTKPEITALANYCDIHGYLQQAADIRKYTGTPLLEIRAGRGRVIASELCLEKGATDPIAQRILSNIINYLRQSPVAATASGQTSSPAP